MLVGKSDYLLVHFVIVLLDQVGFVRQGVQLEEVVQECLGVELRHHVQYFVLSEVPLIAIVQLHNVDSKVSQALASGHKHIFLPLLVVVLEDYQWNLIRFEFGKVFIDPLQIV